MNLESPFFHTTVFCCCDFLLFSPGCCSLCGCCCSTAASHQQQAVGGERVEQFQVVVAVRCQIFCHPVAPRPLGLPSIPYPPAVRAAFDSSRHAPRRCPPAGLIGRAGSRQRRCCKCHQRIDRDSCRIHSTLSSMERRGASKARRDEAHPAG